MILRGGEGLAKRLVEAHDLAVLHPPVLLVQRQGFQRRLAFEGFFQRSHRQALLFHVTRADGQVVSSELVLVSERHLYSFLGGTLSEALPLGANDLLKHGIIEWGREQGKASFVLGGGYQPGDGIFRYKRAFAPDGVVPFAVGRLVFDPEVYAQLVELRQSWEASRGRDWRPSPGFFPEFRAPGAMTRSAASDSSAELPPGLRASSMSESHAP